MDYNKMSYEELVEQLKKHFLFMNITKVKEFFIQTTRHLTRKE